MVPPHPWPRIFLTRSPPFDCDNLIAFALSIRLPPLFMRWPSIFTDRPARFLVVSQGRYMLMVSWGEDDSSRQWRLLFLFGPR